MSIVVVSAIEMKPARIVILAVEKPIVQSGRTEADRSTESYWCGSGLAEVVVEGRNESYSAGTILKYSYSNSTAAGRRDCGHSSARQLRAVVAVEEWDTTSK